MMNGKILLILILLCLMVAVPAEANGGPHGDYTATTDRCAACHRAHTATGDNLLMASSTTDLCFSCHGSGSTGANTNVVDGVFVAGRGGDEGTNTPPNEALLGGLFSSSATSTHDISGTNDQAWGAGGYRGQLGAIDRPLDCASCHDPHGSPNYRIIKETINGVSVTVSQSDETNKDYSTANWARNQSYICGACHDPYQNAAKYANDPSHTHTVDNVFSGSTTFTDGTDTVSVSLANGFIVCQTCHFPHGTKAQMTGYASGAGPAQSSALLRQDNRGVCQSCHQK